MKEKDESKAEGSDQLSDRLIIERCAGGDCESFRLLYRRFERRVRSTLLRLVGAEHLDDLTQEVFVRIWKGLPKVKQPEYLSTWIYRITMNVAFDSRKELAKDRERAANLSMICPAPAQLAAPQGLDNREIVQKGLASLSFEHRSILILHDLEDVPQEEIGSIMGIPTGTVKSRLFYARKAMRDFYHALFKNNR